MVNDVDRVESAIAYMLNYSTMSFPINYLGFLIRPSKLKRDDWLSIIYTINCRISRWNG